MTITAMALTIFDKTGISCSISRILKPLNYSIPSINKIWSCKIKLSICAITTLVTFYQGSIDFPNNLKKTSAIEILLICNEGTKIYTLPLIKRACMALGDWDATIEGGNNPMVGAEYTPNVIVPRSHTTGGRGTVTAVHRTFKIISYRGKVGIFVWVTSW